MKKRTTFEKLELCAGFVQEFMERNGDLWTEELSNAKSGDDSWMTKKKRFFTREIFYGTVGAGGMLNTMSNRDYMVNSCINFRGKKLYDHIISPQLLGEYFMDSYAGYYTPKNVNILDTDVIIDWTKMASKQVLIPNQAGIFPVNQLLARYTSFSNSSKYTVRVTSASKYRYLNEKDNLHDLKGNLVVLHKSSLNPLTESELDELFRVPAGLSEWEQEKYGAISYKEKDVVESNVSHEPATLVAFMK